MINSSSLQTSDQFLGDSAYTVVKRLPDENGLVAVLVKYTQDGGMDVRYFDHDTFIPLFRG